MEQQQSLRYRLLDELRGLDLISMMLYHGMWDVVFLFGIPQKWYIGRPGFLWQQSICWVFLLLSGFCLPMGRHPFKRGAVVFGAGAMVTAVTLLFLPEDVVWFGVLTLLGSAMLLTAALDSLLRRIPPAVGVVLSAALFLGDISHDERLLEPARRAAGSAAGPLCQWSDGLSRLHAEGLFLHRLFPAAAVAVFVLGGVLSPSAGGPCGDGASAPVSLPAAGLDGASLAGDLPAPPAGHPRRADDDLPAGEGSVKNQKS